MNKLCALLLFAASGVQAARLTNIPVARSVQCVKMDDNDMQAMGYGADYANLPPIQQALVRAYRDQASQTKALEELKQAYVVKRGETSHPKVESVLQLFIATVLASHLLEASQYNLLSRIKNERAHKFTRYFYYVLDAAAFAAAARALFNLAWNAVLDRGEQAAISEKEEYLKFLAKSIAETEAIAAVHDQSVQN